MDGEASCMKGALKAPFCLLFTSCSPLIFAFSPLLSFTAGNAEAPAVPLPEPGSCASQTHLHPAAMPIYTPSKALLGSREGWSEAHCAR